MNGTLETGCWIDGHWGQYGITRLIEIAEGFGFELAPEDRAEVDAYLSGVQTDYIYDLAEDAENYLNVMVAERDHIFGWYEGEFFYSAEADWREKF